jgi:hypothetical protein
MMMMAEGQVVDIDMPAERQPRKKRQAHVEIQEVTPESRRRELIDGLGGQLVPAPKPELEYLHPVMDLATAKKRLEEFQQFVKFYLREGEDYGVIPGTRQDTLLKPGADKLCELYGMADTYPETRIRRTEDWDKGLFDYEITCVLVRRSTGEVIGEGMGSCNSYESKYRWRDGKRKCPNCQKETIIKGKEEYGGGWLCFKKQGGCGAKFDENYPPIVRQTVGRTENPDIADVKNTILKMAKKRAKIDAVIAATRSSGIFTQDMEDIAEPPAPAPAAAPAPEPKPQPAPKPQPETKPADAAIANNKAVAEQKKPNGNGGKQTAPPYSPNRIPSKGTLENLSEKLDWIANCSTMDELAEQYDLAFALARDVMDTEAMKQLYEARNARRREMKEAGL